MQRATSSSASSRPKKRASGKDTGTDTANVERRGKKKRSGKGRSRNRPDPARVLWQRLVSVMPDAVVTLKGSQALGHWSVGASRLTGRRRREVQRRGFSCVFKDPKACAQLLAEIDARGRVTDHEATLVSASGDDVPIRVYGTQLRGVDGRPKPRRGRRHKRAGSRGGVQSDDDRYLLVLHDMTEVDRIRSRLIETEKLSAMAKIAGSVAHEFRNPLNSLFLNTDLLEDELEGRKEIQDAIAPTLVAIREEIERLNQIITHYLSLSKIASGRREAMDLGDVVKGFASEWHERAEERGVTLRVRGDEADLPISADPNQVRRVLVNLVENAFDAVADPNEPSEVRARPGRVNYSPVSRRLTRKPSS